MASAQEVTIRPPEQREARRPRETRITFSEIPLPEAPRFGERHLSPAMEGQREVLRTHQPHDLPPEEVKSITNRPVTRWYPDSGTASAIQAEAEKKLKQPLDEAHKPTASGEVGVQAGIRYLEEHEHARATVRITSGGGADIMALSSKGELIIAECKGTGEGKTLDPGWLTAADGKFENQARWLQNNREHMLSRIDDVRREATGDRKKQLDLLYDKVEHCQFGAHDSYRRYVIYAGENLKAENL